MRLLTRSDFDGLASAVLLYENGVVDEHKFVHPKDVQDGTVEVTKNDVLSNIPYAEGCGLWFDHHVSEDERLEGQNIEYEGDSRPAPSATQVIWEYYGGEETFGAQYLPLLEAVNKSDSGNLSRDEVLNPEGFILLSYIMDPRTGLGRYHDYRISNYQLMEHMIGYLREKTAEEILQVPDVQARVKRYNEELEKHKKMLEDNCETHGNVIVTNLLDVEQIIAGNRFFVYAMHPDQNIEIRLMWGRGKEKVVFSVGHSILNRTSKTHVGKLMLEFGGGGHEKVGTCQIEEPRYKEVLAELVERMKKDG